MCITYSLYLLYVCVYVYIYISRVEETWERVILAERMRRMLLLSPLYECKEHYKPVQVQSQPILIKRDTDSINKSSIDVGVNISGESSAAALLQTGELVNNKDSETLVLTPSAVVGQAPILAIDSDDSVHTDSTGAVEVGGAASSMVYSVSSGPGSLRRYVRRINSELYKT